MSTELINRIIELRRISSRFNKNDVLVNASKDNSALLFSEALTFQINDFPKKILSEAKKNVKESGINSLCLAVGRIKFSVAQSIVHSPVFLFPLTYKEDKIQQSITFDFDEEDRFLNPFVSSRLEDLHVETTHLETQSTSEFFSYLENLGLDIDNGIRIVGNFHHHRYQILKDLDDTIANNEFSDSLEQLFGGDHKQLSEHNELPKFELFPCDTDHLKVFDSVRKGNTVIQGPPGTGKSQVLTNLLGKIIFNDENTIVVSEKRAALEVIQKKLAQRNLSQLSFLATSDRLSHAFLDELKSSWSFFEQFETTTINNQCISDQLSANLQMTLDLLLQKDLIGGVSFHEFHALSKDLDFKDCTYSSNVPSIKFIKDHYDDIEKIYDLGIAPSVGYLRNSAISSGALAQLDVKIDNWLQTINSLSDSFELKSFEDLNKIAKKAIQYQVFENDLYNRFSAIFRPESKEQRLFKKVYQQWKKQLILQESHPPLTSWQSLPDEIEVKMLLQRIQANQFFPLLKAKLYWRKISKIPFNLAKSSLEYRQTEIEIEKAIFRLKIKFCDLGVDEPKKDADLIQNTLALYSLDQWNEMERIIPDMRVKLANTHAQISALKEDLTSYFTLSENTKLFDFLITLKKDLPIILSNKKVVTGLNVTSLMCLQRNLSFEAFKSQTYFSHLVQFKERMPRFSNFDPSSIKEKVDAIITQRETEQDLFAREINLRVKNKFDFYHRLLQTPANKLNDAHKQLKFQLRKGKSILVREFAKTKNHPSLRELYSSEAGIWITLLKPIWLSNPTQLVKCFPLKRDLFDYAIFDEASQIPIQNSIGIIQRSRRVIIAGDEHQMGPNTFFKSVGESTIDLLHQAKYNYTSVRLSHHYRSKHASLIAFSNKHFYKNELHPFPSPKGEKTAIQLHKIDEGRYISRKNELEAKAIAASVRTFLNKNESVGIVAFSEEQLSCIWEQLSVADQDKLTELIETDSAFFKALENVQGDECDNLIVSFGYGKNEDGIFQMKFGPINNQNGRKRLNVLLTRARKSIHFFASIGASDFKLSENESINLLRQWFAFIELHNIESKLLFPFKLDPIINGNELTLARIQDYLPDANEVVTLYSVLKERGWKIHFA